MIKCKSPNQFILFALLIVVIFIFIFRKSNEKSGWERVVENISSHEINGIVKEKFTDTQNHNDPIIVMKDTSIIAWCFYDEIEIGDSLCKSKHSTILTIHRGNSEFKLDFKNCFKDRIAKEKSGQ